MDEAAGIDVGRAVLRTAGCDVLIAATRSAGVVRVPIEVLSTDTRDGIVGNAVRFDVAMPARKPAAASIAVMKVSRATGAVVSYFWSFLPHRARRVERRRRSAASGRPALPLAVADEDGARP